MIEKGYIQFVDPRGVDVATKSSKYSMAPFEPKEERTGRTDRVGRGVGRSGRERRDLNRSESNSRRVKAERAVAIASGEMYPE